MDMAEAVLKCRAAFERLCKWRSVFAGWQLGTRAKGDPESDAVRDHREVTICLRAEVNALTRIIMTANPPLVTPEQFQQIMAEEADELSKMYEQKFPGMKAEDWGIRMTLPDVANTMKGWRP